MFWVLEQIRPSDYFNSGAHFVSYAVSTDGITVTPTEDGTDTRYPMGRNWDEVTYYFTSATPPTTARGEVGWPDPFLRDMGGMTFTSPRP